MQYISKLLAAAGTGALPTEVLGGDEVKVQYLINTASNILFYTGIGISLVFVIIGGIKYIASGGDKLQTEEGKKTVSNAVIGLVIILAFKAVVFAVQSAITGQALSGPTTW